jgi:hypothetical protein
MEGTNPSPMEASADAAPGVAPAPEVPIVEKILPRRHPAVATKLGHMDQAMRSLKSKKQEAAQVRSAYETEVKTAIRAMNEAQGLRMMVSKTEAEMREEKRKMHRLAEDRLRLDKTHHHLVSSLHHIMDPKLELADSRVKDEEEEVKGLEEDSSRWKQKEEQFHSSSIAMIEERRASKKRVEDAKAAEAKAQKETEMAEKQYMNDKRNVNFNVQGYRYALAKAHAAQSRQERSEQESREAKVAKKRLESILKMEQRRVDEAMAIGKDRVQGKIHELESKEEDSKLKLSGIMQKYSSWQGTQRKWAKQLASTKQITHVAAEEYAAQQKAILASATAKVAYDAESNSDWAWDAWPGDGRAAEDPGDIP